MQTNEDLILKFYKSFSEKDFKTMQSCYHDEATFNDAAFVNLDSKQVKAMWHMLCENGKDFRLVYSDISSNNTEGKAHWEAYYTFSKTGNKVHNIINASFEFKDGLIFRHKDSFDFYRWAGFAFGVTGKLIGWTPFFKSKIQSGAISSLKHFISKHPEYQ